MRRILSFAVCLLILFSALASCGGERLPEEPGTGSAEQSAPEEIPEEKKVTFFPGDSLVVRRESAPADEVSAVTELVRKLEKKFGAVEYTTDWDRNPLRREREIIVGIFDGDVGDLPGKKTLGKEAFAATVTGGKLIISASDAKGIEIAADLIMTDVERSGKLEYAEGWSFAYSQSKKYDALFVGGVKLTGCRLERYESEYFSAAADRLRAEIFAATGVLLEYGNGGNTVRFRLDGEEPSKAALAVEGGDIVITAGTRVGLHRAVRRLITERLHEISSAPANGTDAVLEPSTADFGTFVAYEDYGAVGDGVHDDLEAIVKAHAAANAAGLPVMTREDAEYYIGGAALTAVIRTDVDWSTSRFVFDDRAVENITQPVFSVEPSYQNQAPKLGPLRAGASNIGYAPGFPCFVQIYNDNVRQYIRQGLNQNSGNVMTDVVLVDADGNVDPSTPLLWDFETVTRCFMRRCDEEPLTLRGGVFTTIANAATGTAYYYRGIKITRSNTSVDSFEHYITGEGDVGQSYYGILDISNCNGVTVKNCVFTGHRTYTKIGSAGSPVSQGTYDLVVTACTSFTATDCVQSNDINDKTRWGVFASNYAKNILFERCSFSRFDAHKGVCNVTLIGCKLGHQGINLIGHGKALISGCTVYGTYFVNLRSDYGSTWNGDVEIVNCDYYPGNGNSKKPIIINGSNDGTLPTSVIITGFVLHDSSGSETPYLFADLNPNYKTATRPIGMPEKIEVNNFTSVSGKRLELAKTPAMFPGVEIITVGG